MSSPAKSNLSKWRFHIAKVQSTENVNGSTLKPLLLFLSRRLLSSRPTKNRLLWIEGFCRSSGDMSIRISGAEFSRCGFVMTSS
jgi:hypothetical protein